jgi:hypothetical protein
LWFRAFSAKNDKIKTQKRIPIRSQNTPVIARRYYPTLSSIVSQDDIPDELGFIKDGICCLEGKSSFAINNALPSAKSSAERL